MKKYSAYFTSPVGFLKIEGTDEYISGLSFVTQEDKSSAHIPDVLRDCQIQLQEYFAGERREFDLPVKQSGTAFQQTVWHELTKIPYGQTVSYKYVAERIGDPQSVRAVGMTNGKNKIAIIVPCHRVIGANGKLVGYAGELWRKRWLLEHERNNLLGIQKLFSES